MYVIGLSAAVAVYTDIKCRKVYNWLTFTVFISGLIYSFCVYIPGLQHVTLTIPGALLIADILWLWLGATINTLVFSVAMFLLGVFGGGDGKYLIAISPWAGCYMYDIILFFFPAAICLTAIYLLYQYKLNIPRFFQDQIHDTIVFFRSIPVILHNLKELNEEVLLNGIPYKTKAISKPPGMIAISIAIIFALVD
jgi:Flp pilus assembly protein protease CpaA